MEGYFEGIICFETLILPIRRLVVSDDEDEVEFGGRVVTATPCKPNGSYTTATRAPEIFDIFGQFAQPNPNSLLPETPIVYKPSQAAIEHASQY